MTDVWDLSAYVEAHPGDLDQRWRLAKKLYTSFEYRLALEHLQVLKNEWGPKANVSRYLAATYYRLGRYEESIREMRNALDKFPDDLAMREQLARTLAVDDQKSAAVAEWKAILKLKPEHRFAKRAITKLQAAIDKEEKEKDEVQRAKIGADLTAESLEQDPNEVVCPSCQEKNSPEFKRCWKCHALLNTNAPVQPVSAFSNTREAPDRGRWPMVTAIGIAAMLALGVFLTLRGISEVPAADGPPATVLAFFDSALMWTRIWLGVTLLIVWPLAWRAGAYIANVEGKIYDDTLYKYGALMALATYAMLWLPWRWVIVALVAPIVFSLVIAFLAFSIPRGAAARLWGVQMAAPLLAAIILITLRHGPGLMLEAPAIVGYVARANDPAPYSSVLSAPGDIRVTWASSGSAWLDDNASRVEGAVQVPRTVRPLVLETLKPDDPPTYEQMRGERFTSAMAAVRAGHPYTYRVHAKEAVRANFTITGLLRPRVEIVPLQVAPGES